jgi:hypothetical protein
MNTETWYEVGAVMKDNVLMTMSEKYDNEPEAIECLESLRADDLGEYALVKFTSTVLTY